MDWMSERKDPEQVELGRDFAPKFDKQGLIPCITVDADTREVLMFAWMNKVALQQTLETGVATYFSRSRKTIWVKGEQSGRRQRVRQLLVDCDQDVLQLKVNVEQEGACHRGYRSCFYREVSLREKGQLEFLEDGPVFRPDDIYN